MANSEPVKVAVEIIDGFSDDLAELEGRLEKIDGKTLNVDLDIDTGRLEEIEGRLEALEEDINTTLKIKTRGYEKAKAQKEDLDGDMFSTLHLGVDKDRLRGLGNLNGGEGFNPPKAGSLSILTGLEGVDLTDDIFSHAFGSLVPESARRFSPNEQGVINDWILNPGVARAAGVDYPGQDGTYRAPNWLQAGIGEKWGPSPRYAGDKKPLDASTDFLRGIREMTDSWSDLKNVGGTIDADSVDLNLDTGIGTRRAAETDFLRGINQATIGSRALRAGDGLFSGSKFGDDLFKAKGFNPELFFPQRGSGQYPWSFPRRAGRMFGRAHSRIGGGLASITGGVELPSGGDIAGSKFFKERQFKKIGSQITKFLPTDMRKWYTLLAMVLPLIIALAGAAMGLVAAFGALATAGVALLGIGLLGWGDSFEESLRNVKKELGELKSELFSVLQPVANVFQPFTAQLFGGLPGMVEKLVEPLKALEQTGYDDWWLESLEGAASWFGDLLWQASELAPQIQAIGTAFGRSFGTWLIDFLVRMTSELYENWEMWARLTRSFLAIINLIYELSKALAFLVALLEPIFIFLGKITDIVGNDFLTSILLAIAAMWALDFALASIIGKGMIAYFQALAGALLGVSSFGGLASLAMAKLSGWLSVIIAKLTWVNALTGGLLALAGFAVGGLAYLSLKNSNTATDSLGGGNVPASRFGRGGSPGSGGTQINIYGDVRNKEYQKLKDEFPSMWTEQKTVDEKTTIQ